MKPITTGIYDALLDEELKSVLQRNPELRSILVKLDSEEEPERYAAFVAKVIEKALRLEDDAGTRLRICNELLEHLARRSGADALINKRLVSSSKNVLLELTPTHYATEGIPRPETSLVESSLFTGSPNDPQLVHELAREMASADTVDILVSFIKWSGLRLLMPAFEDLRSRSAKVRIVTTSYMGASDAPAIEWLAKLPNVTVRISYDTERTRLHAKAYHFRRLTGFSTAYIGSSNMAHAAMTTGLEWNLKVTAEDMPHILEKFDAEFETYWNSQDFVSFNADDPTRLREALQRGKSQPSVPFAVFDIAPHPFQERILDALDAERSRGYTRNLVVAATGTGKTVIAAFDFKRFFDDKKSQARLLFLAHRKEILEQSLATFRGILRITDFGELLVGQHEAVRLDHLFCSVDMLNSRRIWERVGSKFYDFIIVDEAHHGAAEMYRPIFKEFDPTILLGLTATPERMDGKSVAADFGNRFTAEIRLAEALEEKLLCPFHYFGVADPISLADDQFWRNGKYDVSALENVYTRDHVLALRRLDVILNSLLRFEPDLDRVRAIGFCVSIAHAKFMAERFNKKGYRSGVLTGETDSAERRNLLNDFRLGRIRFLFSRDVLNEGLDVPDVNTVMFLRPTESLTVFLQQLGRGLRNAPGKDCLTVLDFVGQVHRRYRIDLKLKSLLSKRRFNIEREVELDFPHLPPGCNIQLDRVAREHVLANIRENLRNLANQVPDRLESFEHEASQSLTFSNFIRFHDYEPALLLTRKTWSEWKAQAHLVTTPTDPDLAVLRASLITASQTTGPREITRLRAVIANLRNGDVSAAVAAAASSAVAVHYRLWGKPGRALGIQTIKASFERLANNPTVLQDLEEILAWSDDESRVGILPIDLPFRHELELHANYGNDEIKAALGGASFESAGVTGVGQLNFPAMKAIAALVTFQKTAKEFSPSTMFRDYPISRELLHWESPSRTSQSSESGKNLILHQERGYTMLFFVRTKKRQHGLTVPFTFLGPAKIRSFRSDRPIQTVWQLAHPMPAEMFEENRQGG